MTPFNFDEVIPRRGTDCVKYDLFEPDVLPLWVADMDFPAPKAVTDALHNRVDHPIFGYTMEMAGLRETICERLERLYDWHVEPHEIVYLPGVVAGFHTAIRANARPNGKVLIQTPIYPPMLNAHGGVGQRMTHAPMTPVRDGASLHYTVDFDVFEDAIDADTHTFLLCSPHNPVGRVWTRDELTQMAAICEKHDLLICSDEIHADLVFDEHVPIAALSPEISQHTITLMAPSKTFNVPSLGFSFAVIQNDELRGRFQQAEGGVVPHVGVLGLTAAKAAYQHGDDWLAYTLEYLKANRDRVRDYVETHLPDVAMAEAEGTYLAWLDLSAYSTPSMKIEPGDGLLETMPAEFFEFLSNGIEPFMLKHANVALNNGKSFGADGAGYARLNFASPRAVLDDALDRMCRAIEGVRA